jgi:hypothetical protein
MLKEMGHFYYRDKEGLDRVAANVLRKRSVS